MKKCNKELEQFEQFEQCSLELGLESEHDDANCNMYDLAEEWFTPSESDSITAKHLKALALELAICIVDEVKDEYGCLKSLHKLVDVVEECSSYEG